MALPACYALRRDRECDVLIVGAGISGAMVADALSDIGLHVISCDRRVPGDGATSASTAIVMHETDVPLVRLGRSIRREDAERLWRRCFLAVHALQDLGHGHQIKNCLQANGTPLQALDFGKELNVG